MILDAHNMVLEEKPCLQNNPIFRKLLSVAIVATTSTLMPGVGLAQGIF